MPDQLFNVLAFLRRLPGNMIKLAIRFYQLAISPMLGKNCKFHPTCSSYMMQAIDKYGAIRGTLKGVWRILRCNPWSKGGEDFP